MSACDYMRVRMCVCAYECVRVSVVEKITVLLCACVRVGKGV